MRGRGLLLFFICTLVLAAGQAQENNILNEQSFGRGATAFFLGSGAGSKVIDPARFDRSNQQYYRSPFFVLGVDHCVFPKASNAYWGLGFMVSSSFTDRSYVADQRSHRSFMTNTLFALKASHHYALFVRRHLDMCSGIVVGTRVKYYHMDEENDGGVKGQDKVEISPALGISATLRYYFRKNFGVYFEACLGYKTDLAHIGVVYKIRKMKD